MLFKRKSKSESNIEENTDNSRQYVIRRSICTGERVAGYLDDKGNFCDIMLLASKNDLHTFCKKYHVLESDIKEIY